jgi:hypothetical protein
MMNDDERRASRGKAYKTVAAVSVLGVLAIVLFGVFVEMDWYGFRWNVLALLILGMLVSIGLAGALMAASFHSARSGIDEESGVLPDEAGYGGSRDDKE